MSYLADQSIIAFIHENNLKTENGTPMTFDERLYLFDIFRDWYPKQVCMKAAQVAWSTTAIVKTFYGAKNKGVDLIYTLPTDNDVNAFAGGKINRIVANNPVFQDWVKEKDTVQQKQVGDHIIYYRGTKSGSAAIMVSADGLIHDEEDRSDQKIISQYASRLQASKKKWEWHFSNPSVMGNGVSKYWEESTQSEWFIPCGECHKEQFMEWPDNVDLDREIFICKFCGAELKNRKIGRWRNRFNSRDYHGYHISLLMCPWVTAHEIIGYYRTKPADYFANFVLGLPYVGEGNTVTDDIILRNCTNEVNKQENVIIGCDSGIEKHYVCGNAQGIFFYGKTESWDDIASMLLKWKNSVAVIDAMPDITGPRKLREDFPGRVFLCHYAKDRKTMQLIRWGEGEESGNVLVDRNRALQFLIDEFADKRIPLQGTPEDYRPYLSHWKTLYRVSDVDSNGSPTFIWESSNGIDHWCHASLYYRVGMDRFGGGNTKFCFGTKIFKNDPAPLILPDGKLMYEKNPLIWKPKAKDGEDWYDRA